MNNIIFFIVVIILHTIIYIYMKSAYIITYTKKININDACTLVKTGDMVLFRWHKVKIYNEFISTFTHVGLVIIVPDLNIPYIIESHAHGDTENMGIMTGGVNIYPFDLRIKKYKGMCFLKQIKTIIPDDDLNLFLTKITNYKKIPFNEKYKSYFIRKCLPYLYHINNLNKTSYQMYCTEFIGFCLKNLKLVDENYIFTCNTPDTIQYVKKNNNFIYDDNIFKIII